MKLRFLLLPFLLACALSAHAQSQFDINGAGFGNFTKSTSGNGLTQQQKTSVGFQVGFRHYRSPLFGWEISYSYNPARQEYGGTGYGYQSAQEHNASADYVVHMPLTHVVKPFALIGPSILFFRPLYGTALATSIRPAVSYGAGADIALFPRLGLRLQYRGLFYRAPDFEQAAYSTSSWTTQAQPMAGLYFKF